MYAALLKHEARLQARSLASYLGVSLAVYASGMVLMLLWIPFLSGLGSIAAAPRRARGPPSPRHWRWSAPAPGSCWRCGF